MIDILIYIKTHIIIFTLILAVIAIISSAIGVSVDSTSLFIISTISLIGILALLPLTEYQHKEILKEEKTISNITYLEIVKIDKKDVNYNIYVDTKPIEDLPNDVRKTFLEYILANKTDKPVLSTKFDNFEYIILYVDGEKQTFKLSDIQDDVVKQYLLVKNFKNN